MEIFSIGLAFMPILFGVAGVALFIYALIDCIKTDESQMRHLPKTNKQIVNYYKKPLLVINILK